MRNTSAAKNKEQKYEINDFHDFLLPRVEFVRILKVKSKVHNVRADFSAPAGLKKETNSFLINVNKTPPV